MRRAAGKVTTMTATDDRVAALRAQLAGDYDEHRRLLAGLDARGAMAGYAALAPPRSSRPSTAGSGHGTATAPR
jgi:hypothetical protein